MFLSLQLIPFFSPPLNVVLRSNQKTPIRLYVSRYGSRYGSAILEFRAFALDPPPSLPLGCPMVSLLIARIEPGGSVISARRAFSVANFLGLVFLLASTNLLSFVSFLFFFWCSNTSQSCCSWAPCAPCFPFYYILRFYYIDTGI